MAIRSALERWLHLRWCHYYQWKNLLTEEREARYQLEQRHQQQTKLALLQTNGSRIAPLLKEQLVSLAQLRRQLRQKRLILNAVQTQQMDALRTEFGEAEALPSCELFRTFSVLRQA